MNHLPLIKDVSREIPSYRDPSTEMHLFQSSLGLHVFVVDGSRIYDVKKNTQDTINNNLCTPKIQADNLNENDLRSILDLLYNHSKTRRIDGVPLYPANLSCMSLNVAQACNMSCGYCYADMGKFGGRARMMEIGVAQASVDRLISESSPGADLVLGYMGGEPLLNRKIVHDITRYAAKAAQKAGHRIRFSITTNGTLINKEDAELFAEFPFTVSVSIDGSREYNDMIRLMNNGSSSYDHLMEGLDMLNQYGHPRHLSARVTVTPKTGELLPILDHIIDLGFDEVGFAAVLVSPISSLSFSTDDFLMFLDRMIACGKKALREISAGKSYPFGNFEIALQQIHRGSHRPYPCGAGAAYLSANAEGNLFACHRLIDDRKYAMGNVWNGSDLKERSDHLARNHVDLMEPCNSCWARYLCGGGCYHEVSRRGRIGCDYIRGWLEFCLKAYVELCSSRPDYFSQLNTESTNIVSTPTTISE